MEAVQRYIARLGDAGAEPGRARAIACANAGAAVAESGLRPASVTDLPGASLLLGRLGAVKRLVWWGTPDATEGFEGVERFGPALLAIPCTTANARALHALLPWTRPVPVAAHRTTIGTGDRIGCATPGHVRAVWPYDAVPVLAQQSQRELNLTGRTLSDVIATATWGVFEEHFTRGYAADADHLKTAGDVHVALAVGATMITLDCSDHIDGSAAGLHDADALGLLRVRRDAPPASWERDYLRRAPTVRGADGRTHRLAFTPAELARIWIVYGRALAFAAQIHGELLAGAACDFELSIDETPTPTTPAAHYLIANELRRAGVRLTGLAPRFIGEFQKGIDYIGDVPEFARDCAVHAAIAHHFGYKLSIHSGSDKFAVFPHIGRQTAGHVHVKTAGTSWLEALRLAALRDAGLFRDLHAHARASFPAASRLYHVRLDPAALPDVSTLPDAELPAVLDEPGHRQLLHIAYGAVLGPNGGAPLRYRLMELLARYEEAHYELLERHLGRHLHALGIAARPAGADPES